MNNRWSMVSRITAVMTVVLVSANRFAEASEEGSHAASDIVPSSEELKLTVRTVVGSYERNKKNGRSYLGDLERIAELVNEYISNHSPSSWDCDTASWFQIACRSLQFNKETEQFYNRICTAIRTGTPMDLSAERTMLEAEVVTN